MAKPRKWKLFGLVGLMIGGLAVLTGRFIKNRRLRRPVY